jgi:hypothetical protein
MSRLHIDARTARAGSEVRRSAHRKAHPCPAPILAAVEAGRAADMTFRVKRSDWFSSLSIGIGIS